MGVLASVYEVFPLPTLFGIVAGFCICRRNSARVAFRPMGQRWEKEFTKWLPNNCGSSIESSFPLRRNLSILNHAGVAPLSRRVAEAMQELAQDALEFGSEHYLQWMAAYQGVRLGRHGCSMRRLQEIAIVKNTSEGIATIAIGIAWKPGDIVVAFQEEFPANLYVWQRLEARGVEIRWLSIFDGLDRIDEAAKGARLLAISFVQYLSGYRVNLDQIGEICQRRDCLFFVDAIQGMGARSPINVESSHIDALFRRWPQMASPRA